MFFISDAGLAHINTEPVFINGCIIQFSSRPSEVITSGVILKCLRFFITKTVFLVHLLRKTDPGEILLFKSFYFCNCERASIKTTFQLLEIMND